MDERTSLNAASITPDYKYAKYLYSVHNNKPYCREMLRQFHKGCASTNGKKMGELSAFTTEVPCMYASREDKKMEKTNNDKKNPEHLNRGDSCWEKRIKALVSLNQVA